MEGFCSLEEVSGHPGPEDRHLVETAAVLQGSRVSERQTGMNPGAQDMMGRKAKEAVEECTLTA